MNLQVQFFCCQLAFFPLLRGAAIVRIPQYRHAGEFGIGFFEQLDSLACQRRLEDGESRNIAAGARQALDQPGRNRITARNENDRDRFGRVLGGCGLGCLSGDEDINLARLENYVLSLDVAERTEFLPQSLKPGALRSGTGSEKPNLGYL